MININNELKENLKTDKLKFNRNKKIKKIDIQWPGISG